MSVKFGKSAIEIIEKGEPNFDFEFCVTHIKECAVNIDIKIFVLVFGQGALNYEPELFVLDFVEHVALRSAQAAQKGALRAGEPQ